MPMANPYGGGLEKSAHKFYAERANPARFLWAKYGTGLCRGPVHIATPTSYGISKSGYEPKNRILCCILL